MGERHHAETRMPWRQLNVSQALGDRTSHQQDRRNQCSKNTYLSKYTHITKLAQQMENEGGLLYHNEKETSERITGAKSLLGLKLL
jgi:hypothetical protein